MYGVNPYRGFESPTLRQTVLTHANFPQLSPRAIDFGREIKRVRSKYDGTSYETCSNLPYGDQQTCTGGSDPSPLHYTGQMRDAETQLDYFGARYYSSAAGHWMSPDWASKPTAVPYAELGNPQTLNLYGMVNGNPVSKQDSDGHIVSFWHQYTWSQMGGLQFYNGDKNMSASLIDGPGGDGNSDSPNDAPSGHHGFWGHLRQHFNNLFHGHGWNYMMNAQVTTAVTYRLPVGQLVGDGMGVVGIATSHTLNLADLGLDIGDIGAVVSAISDPTPENLAWTTVAILGGEPGAIAVAAKDVGVTAADFATYDVIEPVLESAPAPEIPDGYGGTISNPALMDEGDPSKPSGTNYYEDPK